MSDNIQNLIDDLDRENPNWLEDLIAEVEKESERKKLKKDNPYVRDLIRILWPFKNGFSRPRAIDQIRALRVASGLSVPVKFDETVQSAFNQHSRDSAVFRKNGLGAEAGFFFSVGGKGSGKWAVDRDLAFAWLKKKSLADI